MQGVYDEIKSEYFYPPLVGEDAFTAVSSLFRIPDFARAVSKKLVMPLKENLPFKDVLDISAYVLSQGPHYVKPNYKISYSGVYDVTGIPTAFYRKPQEVLAIGYYPVGLDEKFTYNEIKYGIKGKGWIPIQKWLDKARLECEETGPDLDHPKCAIKRLPEKKIPDYIIIVPW